MDGIHDLGGMHGFGPVRAEHDEPVFHARWEARMLALSIAVPFAVPFSDDQFRPAVESIEPARYLAASYYELWCEAVTRLLKKHAVVTADELSGGPIVPLPATLSGTTALKADAVIPAINAGASQARPGRIIASRFRAGDRVRTRSTFGASHTRLPRYARGRRGVVERTHGAFLVADRNSTGDQTPEALYTVRFDARELWGPDVPAGDTLSLDCWDSYLEPAA